jgi:class 3 adenylate cyclase
MRRMLLPRRFPEYASRVAELPSGTVTFLFTDIEGSTALLKQLGEDYGGVLDDHQRLLREAFAAHRGHEIDTQGDSFFVAFRRAKDGVAAAAEAQRALAAHEWPEGVRVSVRMGLHSGEPVVGEERYVGIGVHRAARIGAIGHGGQILLSSATRELVEDDRSRRRRRLGVRGEQRRRHRHAHRSVEPHSDEDRRGRGEPASDLGPGRPRLGDRR